MRKAIFITLIIVELLMGLLTYLVFDSKNSVLLFSGGSVGSTMKIFGPNFWVVFILFLATVASTVLFRKKMKPLLISFLILFSSWFFCGRTIGVHWTGELIAGWFYISTDKIILCEDCSGDAIENTTTENSYLFQLRFINETVEKEIFVGPIVRSDLRSYFDQSETKKN